MGSIERRVSRLEDSAGGGDDPRQVIQIAAKKDETADDAVERHRAEHADAPDNALFVVLVGVSPKHREIGPA